MADPNATPSWVTQVFGDGTNGGPMGGGGINPLTMAGLATAAQQYANSGQYNQTAQDAAKIANPMGDRSYYVDQLKRSYTDPTSFLNDPGNQAALKIAMDKTAASNAAQGYLGSGNMLFDLQNTAQTQNQTYLQSIRDSLGKMAGAQFDPQNAANDLMKGKDQQLQSQNAALAALMMPLAAQNSQNQINGSKSTNPISGLSNPKDIANTVVRLATQSGSSAANFFRQIMNDPTLDQSTRDILNSMQQDPQYAGMFNTGGGTDVAPPDYQSSQFAPDPGIAANLINGGNPNNSQTPFFTGDPNITNTIPQFQTQNPWDSGNAPVYDQIDSINFDTSGGGGV